MARKPTGRPHGRPPIQIDWDQFDKLCSIHCTLEEIADYFECSADTIEIKVKQHFGELFSEIHKKKQGIGKRSLRRMMWESAGKGNTTMMIWLSKQVLGYTDKVDQKTQHSGGIDVNDRSRAIEGIFGDERSRELALELAERMAKPGSPAEGGLQ